MVLKPNGIEPTYLKLDSWSPGAGFIPIITSNILNYIKKKEFKKKKQFYAYKKHLAQFLKLVQSRLGSIPRLPVRDKLKIKQLHKRYSFNDWKKFTL